MLRLGSAKRREVVLTDEERSRHLLILGASGTGKSKLLEYIIRQDIRAGRGLCLIDPHGTLADDIVKWCASRGLEGKRPIRVIEANSGLWSAGFNPLQLSPGIEPSVRVDAMVAACAQVWGGEDMANTPRLKKVLRAVFFALAVRGLTIAEAPLLTSGKLAAVRERLTDGLPDQVFATLWGDLNALSRREFMEVFESTNNRLGEFLTSPLVRRIIGQTKNTFDARRAMDDGEIIIMNLLPGTGLSTDNVRLIGTLLASEFRLCAMQRDVAYGARHPFTLVIDEAADFLTDDIARMLDQTRKFGLSAVLGTQRLSHLRDRSASIYNAVMTGAQTKIVFGGLSDDDAEVMAREIFRSSFNLERPKHALDKPHVVDELPFWLENESDTTGGAGTSLYSYSTTSGASEAGSETGTESFNIDREIIGSSTAIGSVTGSFESSSFSESQSTSRSWSCTRGRSQTLKPVRLILPTVVHSLEEELHLAIVKLRELPRQAAIVKRRGRVPVRFRPQDVVPALSSPRMTARFIEQTREAMPFLTSAEEVDVSIAERDRWWRTGNRKSDERADDGFWSE